MTWTAKVGIIALKPGTHNAYALYRLGFNKTTLSERQGAQGVAGEYQYIADPIHQATRKPKDAPTAVPFKPANPSPSGGPGTTTRNFAGRAKGAVGEFEWQPRPQPPQQQAVSNTSSKPAGQQGTAFKPASTTHAGPLATFNRYPGEHVGDYSALHQVARQIQ